ncbi:BTAD domain-containing putative transcriptional regulator [Plantactinospora sp. DSM 117369]
MQIPRPKLRLLLAVLLARANTWVSVDDLVDDIWGAEPPKCAHSNVRTYVWSLRRLLAPADPAAAPINTGLRGYMIHVTPESLDMFTFERMVADGAEASRQGDFVLASRRLAAALGLWRGAAFQDVPLTAGTLVAAAQRLEEQRLTALEELFDIRLALGEHADVVGELQGLVVHHPLRERLWGQLMVSLYRGGRQTDALAAYQRLRSHLVEEMGVEPSLPLRTLHSQILRSDPALAPPPRVAPAVSWAYTRPPPRQLPLVVPTFVGRAGELSTLLGLVGADDGSDPGSVVIIHGPPGAGKSALALHAADRWSSRFPDGQLYINLLGATSGVEPLCPSVALGRFLRALGVPAAEAPHGIEEAAALYRTLVAARQMVILLDNAATAAQVRPLLPGTSRTVVLVTSRAGLTTIEGATHLCLGPLDPDSSRAMLERLIGESRAAADPSATARLAALCGYLPLGLHVAAARLKARPNWPVQHLVDRLTDERYRLSELAVGDLAVRSSLGVSHSALHRSTDPADRAAARALRLIGLVPATTVDTSTMAALLGTSTAEADRAAERLLDAHLIEAVEPDRYHLHDLVRLFARELAGAVPADEAAPAMTRALCHYAATVRDATRLVYPNRTHYPGPDLDLDLDIAPRPFKCPDEAHRWLEAERTNLLAVTRQSWLGPDDHVRLGIELTLALHWFLAVESYVHDIIELNEPATAAARRLGDRRSEAYTHGSISAALRVLGRVEEACECVGVELSICRELGDRFGEQRALGNLGMSHLIGNRPDEAISYLEQQLTVARQIGAVVGEVFATRALGRAHHQLGQHDEAIRYTEKALAWYDRTNDDYNQAGALERLGLIYLDLGRLTEATNLFNRAVERARRARYALGEAESLIGLAKAWRALGSPKKALGYAEEAVTISERLGVARIRSRAETERAAVIAAADGQPA